MPEDKVVIAPEDEKPQDTVDVTPEPKLSEQDAFIAKVKADVEKLAESRVQQLQSQFDNFRHGAYRKQETLEQEIARLKAASAVSRPVAPATDGKDFWGTVENGQVAKAEVEKLAETKAQEIVRQTQLRQQEAALLAQQQAALTSAKDEVIQKYPDLDPETGDATTEISKAYLKVLNAHPDWTTNPYGPLLAMYEMEKQLKLLPIPSNGAPAGVPTKPRAAQTSLPPSRPMSPGGERLTLTREEKVFCDRHKLDYAVYLKNKQILETSPSGVEIT